MSDKFKPAPKNRVGQISKITPQVEEILRRRLAGQRTKDIAKDMQLSISRISTIINSPLFQEKETLAKHEINERFYDKMSTDVVKNLFTQHSTDAANTLIGLMKKSGSEKIQRDTAIDVLEFGGYNRKPTEDKSVKIFIDQSVKNDIQVALKALKIDEDILKDVVVDDNTVKELNEAGGNQSAEIGNSGETKLLDILQGNNEERLAE